VISPVTGPLHIHAFDALTPLGANIQTSSAALAAGISQFTASGYPGENGPITMALVPPEALAPGCDGLNLWGYVSPWTSHLVRMAHPPLARCFPSQATHPIPTLIIGPELHPRGSEVLEDDFAELLAMQAQVPLCPERSQCLPLGRAGLVPALDRAAHWLAAGEPYVLLGGIDSFQQERLLANLAADERLAGAGPSDSFIPAEGVAWVLLGRAPSPLGLSIDSWAHSEEPGHLFSTSPYLGQALADAFGQLHPAPAPGSISHWLSTANGEHHWAKELGLVHSRHSQAFAPGLQHLHPADCLGDMGAAAGLFLLAWSCQRLLQQPQLGRQLISCSSDQGLRGLLCPARSSLPQ
jgi:3-oxoacyl-[acyl-carrier-protein] synthase I